MIQLIYESRALAEFQQSDLVPLLNQAKERNAQDDISGLLIFHKGTFLQILEGPQDAVESCFQRIEKDPRHDSIWTLARMTMNERAFAHWSMGMATIDELPDGAQAWVRDFGGIKTRMEEFRSQDPDGEAAYTAQIVGRFLKQFRESEAA